TMQGNKKHTEGHSDSSSIGSLLDDTDREVSSLTDRAFKSLCVAELEDSYNEPDLAISPDFTLQFSAKFHPGTLNHAIKKSNACNKLMARNNEHAKRSSTFQQLPNFAPEEKRIAKNTTTERKKLNLPVPGPRNSKPVSKVSSLIKTFDKTADQESGRSLTAIKQPIKNSFQKHKLNHGNYMACWDNTDILSIHKDLPVFSEPSQGNHCLGEKYEAQRRSNKIDLSYFDNNSDSYYPVLIEMSKEAKSHFSRSSKKALKNRSMKVNEPTKKGNFLHSENSAFESWNVHHKKLTEKEESVEFKMKKEGLTYVEEAPFIKGSHICEHKLPPVKTTVAKKQDKDFHIETSPIEAAFSIPLPAQCVPQGPLPSETEFPTLSPQLDKISPPWRKQRVTKGATERGQTSKKFTTSDEMVSLTEKMTDAEPAVDVSLLAKQVNSPPSISPSFNITELLTPIIPPKQAEDPVDIELIPLTPPPPESAAARDHDGSMFGDYKSRDSYKSKASSLLFNLRDVRKRIKRIYAPSPLLKALEEKNRAREYLQESTKMNAPLSTSQEKSDKNIAEKEESNNTTPTLSGSVPQKDDKSDLTTDNYLALSSPQTTADHLFYQTKDNLQQDDSKHKGLAENAGGNENFSLFRQELNQPDLRKCVQYPALKPFIRDGAGVTDRQPLQNPIVQGEENKRQADNQNEECSFQTLPNQLSQTEDVPYSDIQNNMVLTDYEAHRKRSTSSSEQSFISTVEQPLQEEPFPPPASLQESQRTQSEMSSDSKKSDKEGGKDIREDELQYYACITSDTDAAEKREGKVTGNEQGSLMEEKLRTEKREESKAMDSASDSIKVMSIQNSEEPQTPPSSSSTKPCLFMIKDNTFRSPQVIRTVKLPLFRSFSLDDTVSKSYKEMESRFMSPGEKKKKHRNMLRAQEVGWLSWNHRGQQNVRDEATNRAKEAIEPGSTSAALDPSLLEDGGSSFRKLVEENEGTCTLLNKTGEMNEGNFWRQKDEPQTRNAKHGLTEPNLALENDQLQTNPSYPTKRMTNYFKNHNLSNRKGGSCAKKIISKETISPMTGSVSEDHKYSPVFQEALDDILLTEGAPDFSDSLTCSAVTSPMSGSVMNSLAPSSLSDKPKSSGLRETENVTNSALLSMALKSQAETSAEEILDTAQRNLLSCSAGEAESLDLRGHGERAAGKPPAVPPKTEKALRRAKKLASRRKRIQEQQKKHEIEHEDGRRSSQSGRTLVSPLPLGYSPIHLAPHSTCTLSEVITGRLGGPSAISPSLSSIQRKLLQDPDSGQFYVVDLPAEVNLKTFYDPETGKYVQVSVPSSEENLHHPPSSETMNSPYDSYPRVLPLPASSVAVLKSPSQLSEPTWVMTSVPGEPDELPEDVQQDYRYAETVGTQPYIEPSSYSFSQQAEETQGHLQKDMSPAPKDTSLVSFSDLNDFAAEGVP
ncbi:CEFIP protein, partial [Turnix velox]|nr:CEFIP protein [Turnix velox]